MIRVMDEVAAERERQDAKWGQQNHPDDRPGAWWNGRGDGSAVRRRCEEFRLPSPASARDQCDHNARMGDLAWGDILVEEVAEAVGAAHDPAALRAELIQVAAVAVAWVEAIDRRLEGA